MSKIYLCSFASPDLNLSVNRFKNQAKLLNFYENIKVYGSKDLPEKIKLRIKSFNYPVKKMRLYGYACWKPYIIKKYFDELPNEAILQYSDIGCHFNYKGIDRLKDYIELCKKENALVFQYRIPDWYKKYENFKFQEYFEYEYTKAETLNYMGVEKDLKIINSQQIWSGCFFIKKNDFGEKILSEWLSLSGVDDIISDNTSKIDNHKNFKEHRHDQSIFSIICKKNNIFSLSASECEWAEYQNERLWNHLDKFPILAKRDKRFNFIKRFINRQIKNFKRKLNYL